MDVTYLEYTGGQAVDAEFCVETDDGVVLFVDGELTHVNQICRGAPAQCTGDFVRSPLSQGRTPSR